MPKSPQLDRSADHLPPLPSDNKASPSARDVLKRLSAMEQANKPKGRVLSFYLSVKMRAHLEEAEQTYVRREGQPFPRGYWSNVASSAVVKMAQEIVSSYAAGPAATTTTKRIVNTSGDDDGSDLA